MNSMLRSVVCALTVVSATAFSSGVGAGDTSPGFTIEQVLSAPFPSDLRAAPTKGRLAWVFNREGKRNIWIAEPSSEGTYSARQLTNYSEDDGQALVDLAWSAEADSIAYVRGGDEEFSDKPYPNPASIVAGVEQDVWVVSLRGGEPRLLGEGHSPAVSPTGDSVAYILKGQVWLGNLATSDKAQLFHSRGTAHSLRWSPDGRLLAFVSDHGNHSYIGLFSMESKSLTYVDPSSDQDRDPVWSADGRKLAFLRISSAQDHLPFGPRRSGLPWSILVYQVDSQQTKLIFRASEGRGSVFREVVSRNQLLWGAGDRLIFPWERDGWTHLYSLSLGGGEPTLLTPGDFEVEYVSLSPDGKSVVCSSNEDDIDRRHIWRITVDGKRREALTQGTGIETAPVVLSDNQTVAVLRSDPRLPLRPAILEGGKGVQDLAPHEIPSGFPAAQMVTPEAVIFSAADGMTIHGQLFLPANPRGPRRPAIVFFHGGSRRQMLLGWHYNYYYSNAYAMNQFLASRGYVVLSVNYRSGIGYGLEFREALNYGAAGASEYNDVQGAGIYLRSRAEVDRQRIGLWGGSYGGYLTALGLARSSDLFAAGVDLHGVHDWNTELENFVTSYDPQAHADTARVAWESSPLASVKTWRSPVLLIHGDDDRNVPFAQTVALAEALRKQGVDFEELIFPDEVHDFLLYRDWVAAYAAAARFFDRQLQAARAMAGPQ